MEKLNLYQLKTQFEKVLWVTLGWMIISQFVFFYETSMVYSYDCKPEGYDFTTYYIANIIASILAGLIGGAFTVLMMEKWLRNISYFKALSNLFVGFTLIFFLITILTSFFVASQQIGEAFYSPSVFREVWEHLKNFEYLRSYFTWLFIVLSTVIVLLVKDKYGPGVFGDFLLGKYFNPKREERIFMFLDLRSSTMIAEKLGEEKYFNFINEVFKFATPSILNSEGEIYQYVGDEVIISWKTEKGKTNANCIQCFFEIQKALREKSDYFKNTYGIKPEFKAGIHYGHVMAGEIGVVKRDIVFSGDVLNTTARIQSKCNELKVDLLFSKYLLDKIALPHNLFQPKKMGNMELRGKAKKMVLYTV